MIKLKKVLFVYNHKGSWIRNDLEILKKHYDVYEYNYKVNKNIDLKDVVRRTDFIFIWFASYHAINVVRLGKRYNKKIITVSGGYDVSTISHYGLAASFRTRWIPKYVLKNSDVVLAFSNSARAEIRSLVGFVDVVVSFGVDAGRFYPCGVKENMFLTVAYLDKVSWKRKGIDKFIELAQRFELKGEVTKFIVVGSLSDEIQDKVNELFTRGIIPNVDFVGYVSDEELLEYYQKAKVYVQLSEHEGFCSVVAEAMLCNCIPVVSNAGSLPEVVGGKGVMVDDISDSFPSIIKALDMKPDGQREWILDNYCMEKREKTLLEVLR